MSDLYWGFLSCVGSFMNSEVGMLNSKNRLSPHDLHKCFIPCPSRHLVPVSQGIVLCMLIITKIDSANLPELQANNTLP